MNGALQAVVIGGVAYAVAPASFYIGEFSPAAVAQFGPAVNDDHVR